MGRKKKEGIDYFNLEVKFIDDYKIDKLNSLVGARGVAILFFLYSHIYNQGYHAYFEDYDDLYRIIRKAFSYDSL